MGILGPPVPIYSTLVWTISSYLSMYAGTEESWALLAEVMPQGRVKTVRVEKETAERVREKYVRVLWEATAGEWWSRYFFNCLFSIKET